MGSTMKNKIHIIEVENNEKESIKKILENINEKKITYIKNKSYEDKEILEAIQKQTDNQQKQNPVHIAIDKGSIAYRRKIEELIKSEKSFKASA